MKLTKEELEILNNLLDQELSNQEIIEDQIANSKDDIETNSWRLDLAKCMQSQLLVRKLIEHFSN